MSSPTVLLNNLVKDDEIYIDPLSKGYLVGAVAFGNNRLVLFGGIKWFFILLGSAYSLFLCGALFYTTFYVDVSAHVVGIKVQCVHYTLSNILNLLLWKRLKHYYQKLQEFDVTMGCRPIRTVAAVKNCIITCVSVSFVTLVVPIHWYMYDGKVISHQIVYLSLRLLQTIEVHFYGHLLSLLVARLRLINYYMKISLSDHKIVTAPKVDGLTFKSIKLDSRNCEMKKLMDLYCLVIEAYDMLIDAIKWQFAMALTSMFIALLGFSYVAALMVIRGIRPFHIVAMEYSFAAIRAFPLFAPCVFADQIQKEVRRLRENVASRLYENKLNKPGRKAARALLALTEARDLSFSLLQIIDIDISMPFKFMGLLLTYLIILLQFEKVLNLSVL